jgi:uridine kinase
MAADSKPSISRTLALCACEVGKFSVRLLRDPEEAVTSLLTLPFVRAGVLMVGTYYVLESIQRRNKNSSGTSYSRLDESRMDPTDVIGGGKSGSASSSTFPDKIVERLHQNLSDRTPMLNSSAVQVSDFRLPSFSAKDLDVLVIGVAGGSGSGKTTYSKAIFNAFGEDNMTYIMHDSYYKDRSHMSKLERETINFDHPDALDTALLVEHIKLLKQRKAVHIPTYDFANHVRSKEVTRAEPRTLILVEGILIFNDPALYDMFDIKVFIKTDDDVRFIRRMKRDMEERGRTMQMVIDQHLSTVRPMYVKYVEPSMRNADIIVPEGMNTVALDMMVHRLSAYVAARNPAVAQVVDDRVKP